METEKGDERVVRQYVKPEIISEKVFEQDALACAKCTSVPAITIISACSRGRTRKS